MANTPSTITEQRVKECAMLLLTKAEAAIRLGVTTEELENAMRDPRMIAAWDNGRRELRESVHGAIIAEAKAGDISAAKFVDHLLERQGSGATLLPTKSKPDPAVTPAATSLKLVGQTVVDEVFRQSLQKSRGKAAR